MAPECKKDVAYKYISVAKRAVAAGNPGKAKKFLLKAQELYPTSVADSLLASLGDEIPSTSKAESPRARASTPRKRLNSGRKSAPITYGPKQEKAVSDVLNSKDYYEIFGVSKDAPAADIKKAYKKLALRVHPDKNRAPGASEAFKEVQTAMEVLTDPRQRQIYDSKGLLGMSTSSCDLRPFEDKDLVVALTVIGGAFLGGFMAFKLIEYFQKHWKRDTPTATGTNNKTRPS